MSGVIFGDKQRCARLRGADLRHARMNWTGIDPNMVCCVVLCCVVLCCVRCVGSACCVVLCAVLCCVVVYYAIVCLCVCTCVCVCVCVCV